MPAPIIAGIVVYLVAVFAPIALLSPALPSTLPPLPYNPEIILHAHTNVHPHAPPPYLDDSYASLAQAMLVHDRIATGLAQRDFASILVDAGGDVPAVRSELREAYLQRFLHTLDTRAGRDPLMEIADRHRLIGAGRAPGIDRATVIAWFDVRWESLAARESLRAETVPLERLLARVPSSEARAMVSWALDSGCEALLGRGSMGAGDLEACASLRQEFAGMARLLDRDYPVDEARASIDALLGEALRALAAQDAHADERDAERRDAIDAFERAHAMYSRVAEQSPNRRLRRLMLGTAEAMQ